jgi:transposase
MGQITLMTDGERRRQWNKGDRARILAAIAEPGVVVKEVARGAEIGASLVYKWRLESLKAGAVTVAGLAPVVIEAAPMTSS